MSFTSFAILSIYFFFLFPLSQSEVLNEAEHSQNPTTHSIAEQEKKGIKLKFQSCDGGEQNEQFYD